VVKISQITRHTANFHRIYVPQTPEYAPKLTKNPLHQVFKTPL